MQTWHLRFARVAALTLLAALGACGGDDTGEAPTGPDPVGTPDLKFGQVVWTDLADSVIAYSHCDHWHGSIRLRENREQRLRLWFVPTCQEAHDGPPRETWFSLAEHPEYTVRVELLDATIALYDGTSDVFTAIPRRIGASPSYIVVRRNGRVVYRDPQFPTSVQP